MPGDRLKINFDDMGLATVLNRYQLVVPPNQRSYAWEADHVQTLFEDFSIAKRNDDPTYFLGTIVLTRGDGAHFEVADGQQRLATTAILLSAIRDYLHQIGDGGIRAADRYTADYLLTYDPRTEENIPKLRLNSVDAEFFSRVILPAPNDPHRQDNREATVSSHVRLREAAQLARQHVEHIVSQYPRSRHAEILYDWVDFLKDDAIIITIEVPDHIDAFRMFETLNDRGLRASQIDILKNDLFQKAGDRIVELESYWTRMIGIIESIGDDELVLKYVRHYWISRHGPTTEAVLAESVKDRTTSRQSAVDLASALETSALDYTALLNPLHHSRWNSYELRTRGYLSVLTNVLGIEQIRPLLMAVVHRFTPDEAREAFRMFVSWSVRFLVAGGGGGGVLDRHYGLRAKDVTDGVIQTSRQLAEAMSGVIRSDDVFVAAFQTHSVSKNSLARYYLRAMELQRAGDYAPSLGGVDDPVEFNLEHIMPQRPDESWNVDEAVVRSYYKRLGNMVLLSPNENVAIGNRNFAARKPVYARSPFLLTQDVANVDDWGPNEIEERQEVLAQIAVQTWRL